MPKDILPYWNSKFENNHKLPKQNDVLYYDSELEYSIQKILRI